jgi:hypothetical protein
MIYSPKGEARIHQHFADLDHKHRLRRGQQRIDQLREIEKYRNYERAGLIRRAWWWITGPPESDRIER